MSQSCASRGDDIMTRRVGGHGRSRINHPINLCLCYTRRLIDLSRFWQLRWNNNDKKRDNADYAHINTAPSECKTFPLLKDTQIRQSDRRCAQANGTLWGYLWAYAQMCALKGQFRTTQTEKTEEKSQKRIIVTIVFVLPSIISLYKGRRKKTNTKLIKMKHFLKNFFF